jgi:hypothetical protein
MSLGAALLTLVLLIAVIAIVSGPLRPPRARARAEAPGADGAPGRTRSDPALAAASDTAALAAAREAKYRELREAELDYRTGKLSAADYERVQTALRGEALEILNELEARTGAAGDLDLEQRDRVREQQAGEEDRPAIEVALDHRAAAERPGSAAHAESAGEARILAGVHEHQQDQHDGDYDL